MRGCARRGRRCASSCVGGRAQARNVFQGMCQGWDDARPLPHGGPHRAPRLPAHPHLCIQLQGGGRGQQLAGQHTPTPTPTPNPRRHPAARHAHAPALPVGSTSLNVRMVATYWWMMPVALAPACSRRVRRAALGGAGGGRGWGGAWGGMGVEGVNVARHRRGWSDRWPAACGQVEQQPRPPPPPPFRISSNPLANMYPPSTPKWGKGWAALPLLPDGRKGLGLCRR